MSLFRKAESGDSGASLISVAITLVLLLGMSAIAVDLGLAFAEKRTDQIGADTSVMAGAIELVQGNQIDGVVAVVMAFVDTNIRNTSIADWEACTDSSAYPATAIDLGATVQTPCISFDTLERIRVRVPDQYVDTTFGALLGFDLIEVAAAAEALALQFQRLGTPPPFALLSGPTAGELVCLRTNAAGNPPPLIVGMGLNTLPGRDLSQPDPCDDVAYPVDSETLGLLDPWAYFDSAGLVSCRQNANDYFIAAGIDHPIGTFDPPYNYLTDAAKQVQDGTGCSLGSPVTGPNTIAIKTGLTAQELRCGMVSSVGACGTTVPGPAGSGLSSDARLQQGNYLQTTYKFVGEDMDNAALWEFFTKDSNDPTKVLFSDAPSSCDNFASAINDGFTSAVWDYYDKRDALLKCMQDWAAGPPGPPGSSYAPIFRADIWDSGRFAFIPHLAETTTSGLAGQPDGPSPCPDSGGLCVHINDFAPIWLQMLYTQQPSADCDDSGTTGGVDWGVHHAGQQNSCGMGNGNLDRVAAIIIDCGMLPDDVCRSRPGRPGPGGIPTPRLELTK